MTIYKVLLLSFFLTTFGVDSIFACTCTMTPIKEHIKTTKTIVVGKVVKLLDTDEERKEYYFSDPNRSYRILLEIETVYKGRVKKSQVIELGSTFSNCEIYYKNDEKYLLFLEKKGKRYLMRHCSYNEQLDNAKENIKNIEIGLQIPKNKDKQITATTQE